MNLIGLKTISYFLKFSYFFNEKKKKKCKKVNKKKNL